MSAPPAKRRRVEISCHVKKQICQQKLNVPKCTIADLIQFASKEFKLTIGKSTISEILKQSDKWLNMSTESTSFTRARHPKHGKLEDALIMWFNDVRSAHAAVNDEMLIEKAKELGEKMSISDFAYSRGWLQKFKKRHGMSMKEIHGEANSADPEIVNAARTELKEKLKGYAPEDIYNMDETGLFFRLGPNQTLATTSSVTGKKKSKERITVALCSNATGTDKFEPFVIAKAKKPRCFGKTFKPETYARYRNNKKAWMTMSEFIPWLAEFDRRMRLEKRHVILLVDNASSHKLGDLKLTNVELQFLKPNCTAHVQAMDAGIIKSFKCHYRSQLIRIYIVCAEDKVKQTVNLRQVLQMVKIAWDRVTPETISNCFKHVDIMHSDGSETPTDTILQEPMNELQQMLSHPAIAADMSVEDFINFDSMESTGESLTNEDILNIVNPVEDEPVTDAEEVDDLDDPVHNDVSYKDARAGLNTFMSYLEQGSTFDSNATLQRNRRFLDELLAMQQAMTADSCKHAVQKSVTDYFKL